MFSVGKVLEGNDGVEVDRRIVVLTERKGKRNIFIKEGEIVNEDGPVCDEEEPRVAGPRVLQRNRLRY